MFSFYLVLIIHKIRGLVVYVSKYETTVFFQIFILPINKEGVDL